VWIIVLILFFEKICRSLGHQERRQTRETSSPAGLARRSPRSLPARGRLPRRGQGRAPCGRERELTDVHGGAPRGRGEARTATAWQSRASLVVPSSYPNSRSPWSPVAAVAGAASRPPDPSPRALFGTLSPRHWRAGEPAPPLPTSSRALRAPRGGLRRRGWTTLPRGRASDDRTTCCSLPGVRMKCFEMFQFVSPDVAEAF
jgi:hypothetical protein